MSKKTLEGKKAGESKKPRSSKGAGEERGGPSLSPHLDDRGRVHMVDVGAKAETTRTARARAVVIMERETARRLRAGDTPKGDVLATVRLAAIVAAKRTPDIVPLAHPIRLTKVAVEIELQDDRAVIDVTTRADDRTGVEMEAMTAAAAGALTLYDMLKALDRAMRFEVALLEKTGGKSGDFRRPDP